MGADFPDKIAQPVRIQDFAAVVDDDEVVAATGHFGKRNLGHIPLNSIGTQMNAVRRSRNQKKPLTINL
jgi:hypothetical protein